MSSTLGIIWKDDLFLDLKDELNETSPTETTLIRKTNIVIKDVLASQDPPSTIKINTIYFCGDDWEKYQYPSDAKSNAVIDLRPRDNLNTKPLRLASPWRFAQYQTGEMFTLQPGQGVETLKIKHELWSGSTTLISSCDTSATTDGTWTAGTGASNVTFDEYDYKTGDGAINFDVSGTTATISFAKSTTLDISGYTLQQRLRLFMKLPTAPSSIAIRWGSDSSNYYSHSITTQSDGSAFSTNDWNELEAIKASATTTGSPDDEAIDYFAIVLTFSGSTTDTDFIIDYIQIIKPEELTLEYYSRYGAFSSASVYQDDLTVSASTEDRINLYEEWRNIIIYGVCWRYFIGLNDKRADYYRGLYEAEKLKLRIKYPSRRKQYTRQRRLPRLNSF